MPKEKSFMTGTMYRQIAMIINRCKDADLKKQIADHFATEFRKTYPSFDPYSWERATGGTVQGYNILTGKFDD